MIHAFTSSAPNYLGKVLALCESLRRHCPDMVVHWLVSDLRNQAVVDAIPPGIVDEVHFVDDFPALGDVTWLFQHTLVELSTAIKPAVAQSLLDRSDCEALLYFDPDMVLFSPVDDILEELEESSLVLTPHLLVPEVEHDAVLDNELCSLRHGIFNLGFFGVRDCPEGGAFVEWWRDRCRAFCWGDWRSGVFTDQKWVNFAPIFFPQTRILRSPRFNVAPWNVHRRRLEGTFDEGFTVEGEPLGFYHFTGFDSGAHRTVLERYCPGNLALLGLVDWYAARTRSLTPEPPLRWSLGRFDNGAAVLENHRHIYRDRPDLQSVFPDPLRVSEDGRCLFAWMKYTGPIEYPELLGRARSVGEVAGADS